MLYGCVINLCASCAAMQNMEKGTGPHNCENEDGLVAHLVSSLDYLIFAWTFCLFGGITDSSHPL